MEDHLDASKNPGLKFGKINVASEDDWVLKLDVTGLAPSTKYVFAFTDGNISSIVGETTTAPAEDEDVEELTYAVFSCSHFTNGYFHAYDVASTIEDLDLWIHTGDYIYEYGDFSTYATDSAERLALLDPKCEMSELSHYRRRHALYVGHDEGLRNIRRRAPMMAVWDDHELTNNPYGHGSVSDTGAENHQEFCSANYTSPNAEKASAKCDRDEGSVDIRFNYAAQAYFEWMPLRDIAGSMGVIEGYSLTKTIEWGHLATFAQFDTRVTDRSEEPTLASVFGEFGYAFVNPNWTTYDDPNSTAYVTFQATSDSVWGKMKNETFTMIGPKNMEYLEDAFIASATAGKPWQIFIGATMMGPNIPPNLCTFDELLDDPNEKEVIKGFNQAFLGGESSGFFRSACAMAYTQTPWNRDDFNGFVHEKKQILDICKNANNCVALGGDLHDSWAWQLYEDAELDGTPVAINLGAPGVTSPGWGPFLEPVYGSVKDMIGGEKGVQQMIQKGFYASNAGLKYGEMFHKGFFAVKATKTTHTTEYFLFEPEVILSDYMAARNSSSGLTADYYCGASLVTTAGEKGSLEPQEKCGAISFDKTSRPVVWEIPVPAGFSDDVPEELDNSSPGEGIFSFIWTAVLMLISLCE